LRHELGCSDRVEAAVYLEHEKAANLSKELAIMIEKFERQQTDLQEMRLQKVSEWSVSGPENHDNVSPETGGVVQADRTAALEAEVCSLRALVEEHAKREAIMLEEMQSAQGESEPHPRKQSAPAAERSPAVEEEVGGLHILVQQLAEELGRMHSAHAEIAAEKGAAQGQQAEVTSKLEEVEAVNDTMAEELLRMRLARAEEPAVEHEAEPEPAYAPRIRPMRPAVVGGPGNSTNRAHSQLLADALAKENRRLRQATSGVTRGVTSAGEDAAFAA